MSPARSLFALSDLHVGNPKNRARLATLEDHPHDWLILAGDLGEKEEHLEAVFTATTSRFAQVVWVPGNHELWSVGSGPDALRGDHKYRRLVEVARAQGVLTPEDPYPVFESSDGSRSRIAPLWLLYDYSFRPDHVPVDGAVAWAMEEDLLCADEALLHPDPYESRAAWCAARCEDAERRLAEHADADVPYVLVNHFPLLASLIHIPRIPRFTIWCGTRRTRDWHRKFPVRAAVYGHLHTPGRKDRDGVPFYEVSVGYPGQYDPGLRLEQQLVRVL